MFFYATNVDKITVYVSTKALITLYYMIGIISIGEMTENNRTFTEIHKRELASFQPFDVHMIRRKSITGTFTTACPSSQAKSKVMSMPRQLPEGEDDKACVRPTQTSPPAEEEDEKHIVTFSINQAPLQPVPRGESPFYRCVKPPDCYYIVEEEISPICTLFHQMLRHSIGIPDLPSMLGVLQLHETTSNYTTHESTFVLKYYVLRQIAPIK